MEEAALHYVNKQTASVVEEGDPTILALFATNSEVDTFNQFVMTTRALEIISIPTSDSTSIISRGTKDSDRRSVSRPYQSVENDLVDSAEVAERRKKFTKKILGETRLR